MCDLGNELVQHIPQFKWIYLVGEYHDVGAEAFYRLDMKFVICFAVKYPEMFEIRPDVIQAVELDTAFEDPDIVQRVVEIPDIEIQTGDYSECDAHGPGAGENPVNNENRADNSADQIPPAAFFMIDPRRSPPLQS